MDGGRPARRVEADGVRALDQLGDGAAARAAGPRRGRRAGRAAGAAVPARRTRSSRRRARPYAGEGKDLAAQIARVEETLGLGAHAGGSNNWVVSGERSVTGRPLLACDPHLTTTIPDLWYEADLACDEFRVRGATLPTNPVPGLRADRATPPGASRT